MAPAMLNILLTSFPGLGLPPTLSFPLSPSTSINDFVSKLSDRLPQLGCRITLTNNSNKEIKLSSSASLSSLLSRDTDTFLPLRLSVPLCGGKGGFGSQLRAAGGRMSSRRKKNQGDSNSSNRNLDGRRLRTITEAKALAEYLALKPEMEKQEREARRKRWEQVVQLAEKREYDIRNGSRGRVDGKWVEDKEEAEEQTREAVSLAMRMGEYQDNLKMAGSGSSSGGSHGSSEGSDDDESKQNRRSHVPGFSTKQLDPPSRSYYGFDEDDEFMSEGGDDESMHEPGDEEEDGGDPGLRKEDKLTQEEFSGPANVNI
ncbi:hypothetical protein MMC31_004578 [Peltigera leucophlebia]|nr:hypothetical protein [Peltigera leucophlebia]